MDSLLQLADDEGITLKYEYLIPQLHTLGLYDNDENGNITIVLHSALKDYPRLQKCILAEELGHHFTSYGRSFYKAANFDFWKLNHIKTEIKALKWSAFYLVTEEKLKHAIEKEKLHTVYELEEYFDITRELMLFRLRYKKDISFLCLNQLVIEEDEYLRKVLGNL